jgi:hypothetical protein
MRSCAAALSAPGPKRRVMSIAFPEGVIVRTIRIFIFSAYMTVCVAALILGPLIILHGYRAWWVDTFYGALGIAAIGGNISHYRTARRNNHS